MDVEQIERLEALLAKATPAGDWAVSAITQHGDVTIGSGRFVVASVHNGMDLGRVLFDRHPERQFATADLIAEAINALPSLLQLARAVSDAPKVKLDWGSFNRGLYVGETWEEAQVNEAALEGQTVALVPVPVKEGA